MTDFARLVRIIEHNLPDTLEQSELAGLITGLLRYYGLSSAEAEPLLTTIIKLMKSEENA